MLEVHVTILYTSRKGERHTQLSSKSDIFKMLFVYLILLVQLVLGACEIDELSNGQPNPDVVAVNDQPNPDIITVIKNIKKKVSTMQLRNEKRDEIVFRLLKTVEKQGQEMAKRDIMLSDLLQEVRSNKDDIKELKEEVGRKHIGDLERDVHRISEIMMTIPWRLHAECKHSFPIRSSYANIKYPYTGKYGNHEDCEWNVETAGNVTLTFTHFDMNHDRRLYHDDYVAVYAGNLKVGQWDTSTGPPPVLNLKGEIRIVFQSGHRYGYQGTGFNVYMQPLNH